MIKARIRKRWAPAPDSAGFSLQVDLEAAGGVTVLFGPSGAGKTQLWLSTGEASLDRSQVDGDFDGRNRAAMLQRTQPLTASLALVGSAGLSSYDRPSGDITALNLGLGVLVNTR